MATLQALEGARERIQFSISIVLNHGKLTTETLISPVVLKIINAFFKKKLALIVNPKLQVIFR